MRKKAKSPAKGTISRSHVSEKRSGVWFYPALVICLVLSFVALRNYKIIRAQLVLHNIGPWAQYGTEISRYKSALGSVGYKGDGPITNVAASIHPLEQHVRAASISSGLPEEIIWTLLEKESQKGRLITPRFEKSWLSNAKKLATTEMEQRMWASSHGPLQIAGWWVVENARRNGESLEHLSWENLYDLDYHFKLGAQIFSDCLQLATRNSSVSRSSAIHRAFACYNGSGAQAARYADSAWDILAARLIDKL